MPAVGRYIRVQAELRDTETRGYSDFTKVSLFLSQVIVLK